MKFVSCFGAWLLKIRYIEFEKRKNIPNMFHREVLGKCSARTMPRMRQIRSCHRGDRSSTVGIEAMKVLAMGYLKLFPKARVM
jgi:hypothetical protein